MTDAERLFNETFARWLRASAIVSNFRGTFTTLASSAEEHLKATGTELFRRLHEDPEWRGLLVDIKTGKPASASPASVYEKLGDVAAREVFDTSYASLDAAVLVFYHSVLDASAIDYCRVTVLHAPQDWEPDLKNVQVQLFEARQKSYDQLLQAKLDERLKQLQRESLLVKIDRLSARCKPPSRWSPMKDYAFDRGRIERFDLQRHEIVHEKALGKPLTIFEVSDENLWYIQQTGMFLMGLVNFRYQLKIDPNYWPQATHK